MCWDVVLNVFVKSSFLSNNLPAQWCISRHKTSNLIYCQFNSLTTVSNCIRSKREHLLRFMWHVGQGRLHAALPSDCSAQAHSTYHTQCDPWIMWKIQRERNSTSVPSPDPSDFSSPSLWFSFLTHTPCSHSLSHSLFSLRTHKHQAECWFYLAVHLFLRMFGATTLKEYTTSTSDTLPHEGLQANTSNESYLVREMIKVMKL